MQGRGACLLLGQVQGGDGDAWVHLCSVRGSRLCELLQARSEDSPSRANNGAGFNKNVMGRADGSYLELVY